ITTVVLLWFAVGTTAAYPLFVALDWALRRRVTVTGVPVEVDPGAAGAGEVVSGLVEADVLVGGVSGGHLALILLAPVLTAVAAPYAAGARLLDDVDGLV